jgi:hypothetical protein
MSLNLDFISAEFNLNGVNDSESSVYVFEGYRLDVSRRMLYRSERELVLPPKAIETLIALGPGWHGTRQFAIYPCAFRKGLYART